MNCIQTEISRLERNCAKLHCSCCEVMSVLSAIFILSVLLSSLHRKPSEILVINEKYKKKCLSTYLPPNNLSLALFLSKSRRPKQEHLNQTLLCFHCSGVIPLTLLSQQKICLGHHITVSVHYAIFPLFLWNTKCDFS